MEEDFLSMVDQHGRNIDMFTPLVDRNDDRIQVLFAMEDCIQDCKDSFTVALALFNASSRYHVTNSATLKLKEYHDRFLAARKKIRDAIEMRFQQLREQEVAHHTNVTEAIPVSVEISKLRDFLVLSSAGQGDMDSDTQHGDDARMSEEYNTAESQPLADNPNRHILEEIGTNTGVHKKRKWSTLACFLIKLLSGL